MKAQFLKISGHKNEKDFYKEFPSYDSFMAKHGAKLKKAQNGLQTDSNGNGVPDYLENINPNQAMQQYQQMFPAGNVPTKQFGPQMGVSQNAIGTLQSFNNNFSNINNGQGIGGTLKGMFAGGDAGNGGLGKAFGDIGKSFGIGEGSGATGATGAAGGAGKGISGAMGGGGKGGGMGNAGGYVEAAMSVVEGIGALKGEKKAKKKAYSDRDVVDIVRQAYDTKDVNKRQDYMDSAARTRKALMPTVDADDLFPTYGVGTNILSKNGKKLKKANHGEIMNTFSPGTIYDDLGYESTYQPMTDVELVKAYASGGLITAQNGYTLDNYNTVMSTLSQGNQMMALGNKYSQTANIGKFDNAGGKIGSGIGQAVGTYFGGPLGGMVGKWAGKYVGGALDPNYKKIAGANYQKEEDLNYMRNSTGLQNIIAGGYSANARHGGNLRSNSIGEIEAVSGGYLEPISYNPHTSGTGITSMIKGQSHDESNGRHSGVIIDYNGKHVEAERGEPISERQDGGSVGESAVIAGDQTFGKFGVSILPHLEKYEGKKIKNIQKEIAEKDAKLNKFDSKNSIALSDFEPRTAIDKLTLNSYVKNAEGIQQKYKINAREVDDLLAYQEAVNSTADVMEADAGDLSRGKINYVPKDSAYAKNGTTTDKTTIPVERVKKTTALKSVPIGQHNNPEPYYGGITQDLVKRLQQENPWYEWEGFDPNRKGDVLKFQTAFNELSDKIGSSAHLNLDDKLGIQTASARINMADPDNPKATVEKKQDPNYDVTPYRQTGLETAAAMIAPWLRKSPGIDLDNSQIAGELGALTDQADPVQARFYHPNLRTPYDVSYQDQLNENQADFNQLTRVSGDNPQALAALAAGKYAANSKVLAEQFRANQAMKENVYTQNTNTLNDALLKNLSIADQQYVRQSQAKSNTKEVRKAALDSIALKTNQNRLNNQKLQVGSNEFADFSYDSAGRLIKTGAPTSFYIPQNYTPDSSKTTHMPIYDTNGNITGYQEVDKTALKKERNGGIVKAFKNL